MATGANAFLELSLVKLCGAHAAVEIGSLAPVAGRRRMSLMARMDLAGSGRRRVGDVGSIVGTSGTSGGEAASGVGANGGHERAREVVRIAWDPSNPYAPTFEDILKVFWESHDPTHVPIDDAHASVVYYENETQRELAERQVERKIEELTGEVLTRVENALEYVFHAAPERLQRRLVRASEDRSWHGSHERKPSASLSEISAKTPWYGCSASEMYVGGMNSVNKAARAEGNDLISKITNAIVWLIEWIKVVTVHAAAAIVRPESR